MENFERLEYYICWKLLQNYTKLDVIWCNWIWKFNILVVWGPWLACVSLEYNFSKTHSFQIHSFFRSLNVTPIFQSTSFTHSIKKSVNFHLEHSPQDFNHSTTTKIKNISPHLALPKSDQSTSVSVYGIPHCLLFNIFHQKKTI